MSSDVWRPLMAMVNLAAVQARIPVVFVVDMDFRQHARDMYRLGNWSLRAYLVNRLFHEPLKWLQVWSASRFCALVMLKSSRMVQDFGRGRAHVKDFFDTAHSAEHVLSAESLSERLANIRDRQRPLQMVYFGRLVPNKGIDRAIEAVHLARLKGADVRLSVIGDGPCLAALQKQVAEMQLGGHVSFRQQVGYGAELFEKLREADFAIATPLIEDTPRAAFDAMARGIPIVAFDMPYFRTLARSSGAVVLAQWPDAADLAQRVSELCRDREWLADMAVRAVEFARKNTQRAWLERRVEWILHYALGEPRNGSSQEAAEAEDAPCR
jgi:glycosyltransferase involved in cell wall biosynthesis